MPPGDGSPGVGSPGVGSPAPVLPVTEAPPAVPGVWVGSWRIQTVFGLGLCGARHAALALVRPGGGVRVFELTGWVERLRNAIDVAAGAPRFAPWHDYRWVRVGEGAAVERAERAALAARERFEGRLYALGDSNRFVRDALGRSGLRLTADQRAALGWLPGFGGAGPRDGPR